jgi:hypothetical protein
MYARLRGIPEAKVVSTVDGLIKRLGLVYYTSPIC